MPDSDSPYKNLRELLARGWPTRTAIVGLVETLGIDGSELLDSGSTPLEIWHHLLSGRRDKISAIAAAAAVLHPGQAKLIERLMEAWMRAAPPPPCPFHRLSRRLFNLPASIGSLCKGREAFLERLHQSLRAGIGGEAAAITAPQAVHGLGGIGKTRTAIEYARRHQEDYSVLIMVGADSESALRTNLANLAFSDAFGLPEQSAPEEDARFEAVLRWLDANPGWLLILDNVDTEEAASAVEDLLGRLSAGYVLITSRLDGWSGQVQGSDLGKLREEDAISFLIERTGGRRQAKASDGEAAGALAFRLDGLALALEQAGAYIAAHRISFARYVEIFDTRRADMLKWCDPRLMRYPVSVAVTWQASFDQLSADARRLLDSLAFLAPAPLPRSIIGNTPECPALEEALLELSRYSLVNFPDEPPESFSLHRLVQEIVLSQLGDTAREAWERAVTLLFHEAPKNSQDVSTWNLWRWLAPHCAAVFHKNNLCDKFIYARSLLGTYSCFLSQCNGDYNSAESFLRRALEAQRSALGEDHPDTLNSLSNLAGILKLKGDFAAAEEIALKVLEIEMRIWGMEQPDSLSNLAVVLKAKGQFAAAEFLLRRSIAIQKTQLSPEHPDVLISLSNLATLLSTKGDLEGAESLFRQVLIIRQRVCGVEHLDTLTALANLAGLLYTRKNFEAAEPLLRQALDGQNRILGAKHPETLDSFSNLALLLIAKGNFEMAEPLLDQVLKDQERVLGSKHPRTLASRDTLDKLLQTKNLSK
ncbi:MAG: motif domain protein [Verrucomicrobiales bacterium]|nr:motif domain protein [Verrucomicrobiales bacterium]